MTEGERRAQNPEDLSEGVAHPQEEPEEAAERTRQDLQPGTTDRGIVPGHEERSRE